MYKRVLSSVPGAPPQNVAAYAESSTSLRVVWEPPPENKQNGMIVYYKIFYVPKSRSDSDATVVEIKNPGAREFVLDELLKWKDYRIWMLAGTSVGDGPKSTPIEVKTDEDGKRLLALSYLSFQPESVVRLILYFLVQSYCILIILLNLSTNLGFSKG